MENPYEYLNEYIGKPLNYKKEFCSLANVDYKTGKAKGLQINKLKQYMDINVEGRNIVIKKIYSDNEMQLIEKHGKFTSYIENILIDFLRKIYSADKNYEIRFTYREIFEKCGVLNKMFYEVYRPLRDSDIGIMGYEEYVSSKLNIPKDSVYLGLNYFLEYSENLLKRMIKDSFESMENRKLIIKSKSYRLYKRVSINGKTYIKKYDCTDKEISIILGIYLDIMKKYNISQENEIYCLSDNKRVNFFNDINNSIKKRFNYEFHAPTFKIVLAEGAFNMEYKPSFNKLKLNKNVQKKLDCAESIKRTVPETQRKQFIEDLISIEKNQMIL